MTRPAMFIGKENAGHATKAALECAEQLDITSIAFPGLGTGVGGLKAAEAAQVMVQEIKKHIETGTSINRILLVGFGADLTQAFKREIETLLRLP